MECGCGHGAPQDSKHVLSECLRSKQFREDMFLDMRGGIKGVGALKWWDSCSVEERMVALFKEERMPACSKECDDGLRVKLGSWMAKLFLKLGVWYGGDKDLREMVVPVQMVAGGGGGVVVDVV